MAGWIKLHRKIFDNPVVNKDSDHLAVWIYLLTEATHKEFPTLFGGRKITLGPGQLVTGRKKISSVTGVQESKVKRILKLFENDQQIDQQSKPYGSLISIVNWDKYQGCDQQTGQQVTNEWTTNDQQVTTKQECKEGKNKYKAEIEEIISYLNSKVNGHYRTSTKSTQTLIARWLKQDFTVDDFKAVIDKKYSEWIGTEQQKYIRPETLFGNKFENYLNQIDSPALNTNTTKPNTVYKSEEQLEYERRMSEELRRKEREEWRNGQKSSWLP